MDLIYLDNNATTRPAPEVVAAVIPFLNECWGNPSSVHRFGLRARQAVDEARNAVAQLIGCRDSELFFTSGGTESINTAVRGLLAGRKPRSQIVTSAVEHSATREVCARLAKEGAQIVEIGVDADGALDLDALRHAVGEQTALVSIMWANNETGAIFPVDEIASICQQAAVPFHCDATQAVGKIPVNIAQLGVAAMSFSGHKFHSPKGVGGLFVRRGVRLGGLIVGGPQERNRRGGTENVPAIVGMGAAAARLSSPKSALAQSRLADMAGVAQLRDRLENEILRRIPDTAVNAGRRPRIPNTTNVGFRALEAEAILLLLSEQGVCASAGAACSSGSLEPSHVLKAMNVDEKFAHGSIRFSLSRYTTADEIDKALEILEPAIRRLRKVLPVSGGPGLPIFPDKK